MMNSDERNDIESAYKHLGRAIDEVGIENAALYLAKVVLVLSETLAPGVLEDALRRAAPRTVQAGNSSQAS